MSVQKYEIKKNYYLSPGIEIKSLSTKQYKALTSSIASCDDICQFITEPERNRSVKTVDSDPEFARWHEKDIDF